MSQVDRQQSKQVETRLMESCVMFVRLQVLCRRFVNDTIQYTYSAKCLCIY